ncbi:MAG: Ig-like domain-containing protein [Mycobacterium sp.]
MNSARPDLPKLNPDSVRPAPSVKYEPESNVRDGTVVSGRVDLGDVATVAVSNTLAVSPGVSARWHRGPRIDAPPSRGSVKVNPDGTFSYIADESLARTGGGDAFTVTVTDWLGRSTFVPVDVVVNSTSPNGGYTAIGSDNGLTRGAVIGGDSQQTLNYSIATGPEKGTVQLDAVTGQFTYAPNLSARHHAAANGATLADLADSFTIKVSGGRGGSYHVPVGIALEPYNTTPVFNVVSVGSNVINGSVAAAVVAYDADSDGLLFTVARGPAFGSLTTTPTAPLSSGETAVFDYVPTDAARGAAMRGGPDEDTFTVTVDDRHGGLVVAVVSVPISPANADPVANVNVSGISTNGAVTASVDGQDPDGDDLTYTVTAGPAFGSISQASVSVASSQFVYTPTATARHAVVAGGPGVDTFVVRVRDAFGGFVDVPVAVPIEAANAHPIGAFAAGNPDAGSGAVSGSAIATDADGDVLAYALSNGPAYGTVSVNAVTGAFVYTPTVMARHGASGGGPAVDGFTVRVTDGFGGSADVPVTVAIGPANANPTGSFTAGNPDVGSGAVTGAVLGADADGDALAYLMTGSPVNGSVSLNVVTGAFVYIPTGVARHAAAAAPAAMDGFTVRISDGFGGSVDVAVAVAIGSSNANPTASFTAGSADAGSGVVTGSVTATDTDGDVLSYGLLSGPGNGSVTINAATGAFDYTPTSAARQSAAAAGPTTDSFTVAITDGHGGTVNQLVSVPIAPIAGCLGCAFVASSASNTVTAIDTDTNTVVASIPFGSGPFGVVFNPAGTLVYVSNDGANTVSVIDAMTNTLVRTITVGSNARGIAITPDGNRVYVTNRGSNTVSVISTATNTVIATIPVGSYPNSVAVSPDGSRAYVNNYFSNSVSVINVATNAVTATIAVGGMPFGVAVNPAGTRAYVANQGGGVSVIDTSTNTVSTTIAVGSGPFAVTFNPSGTRAYVTNHFAGTVSVINTATNSVTSTITVGTNPSGVGVSPDGSRLYVAVGGNPSSVKVIDTATNALISSFAVANGPSILAMSPL